MRDYGKVAPAFWIGSTGKGLRGDMEAQIVALYLMTSPHASMTGVFYCPIDFIAKETGIPFEGASKALARLCEGGFCDYEADSEVVFVFRMAAFQIGEELAEKDNRRAGLQKDFDKMPDTRVKAKFFEIYGKAFGLQKSKGLPSPSKAPPKPRAGTGAGAEVSSAKASRLPADWTLPDDFADEGKRIAAESGKRVDVKREGEKFRDFWVAKAGKDAAKLDWPATWRNWIRNACERAPAGAASIGTMGEDL